MGSSNGALREPQVSQLLHGGGFSLQYESMRLADGRMLAYIVDGPKMDQNFLQNYPVIFLFHGMLSTGEDSFVQKKHGYLYPSPPKNCVLVAVDRPGYGRSSDAPEDWSYAKFAQDIQALATHLGVAKFAVAGHSSGGPNALACAVHLKDQVVACGFIAGDSEYVTSHVADPAEGIKCCSRCCKWCLVDCIILPCQKGWCCKSAASGFITDYEIERRKYDFEPKDVSCPLLIFTGSLDKDTIASCEHTKTIVNGAKLTMLEGVDHMTILAQKNLVPIIDELAQLTKKQQSNQPVATPVGATPMVATTVVANPVHATPVDTNMAVGITAPASGTGL